MLVHPHLGNPEQKLNKGAVLAQCRGHQDCGSFLHLASLTRELSSEPVSTPGCAVLLDILLAACNRCRALS